MKINGYCNTYARDGAPDQTPPPLAPAPQPQMRTFGPSTRNNGNDDAFGVPTRNAVQPLQRQQPDAGIPPGGSIDDANGNHIRDRWDDGGSHVRDSWNDRNGARAHEMWDADGTHVRDAWNEQTGQHMRDTWTADGAHMRDSWDEQGNHLQETWTAQGRYLHTAWNELTARMQNMLKRDDDLAADPANNAVKPVRTAPASPGNTSSQPAPDPDDAPNRSPDAGPRRADPYVTNPGSRPVGDGTYGHGTAGSTAHGDPGEGGGDGGAGGAVGPTGGAGNVGQMRNTSPGGDATVPDIDRGTDAPQLSRTALNRLNGAPEKLMHLLDLALERLDKYGTDDPELQQWFGKNADVNEIKRALTRMRETLASGDYKLSLDPGTRDGWEMAHVFPDDGTHTIHVRPHILDQVFGKNTPEVTIAHELSHFNDISGTRDLAYGDQNALSLARTNSRLAMHNAENYGMFIRQVSKLSESA